MCGLSIVFIRLGIFSHALSACFPPARLRGRPCERGDAVRTGKVDEGERGTDDMGATRLHEFGSSKTSRRSSRAPRRYVDTSASALAGGKEDMEV